MRVGRFIACDEKDRLRDLLRGCRAFGGYRRQKAGLHLFVTSDKALEHLSLYRSRRNGVHSYSRGSTFECSGLRQTFDRVLTRDIHGRARYPTLPPIDERLTIDPARCFSITRISCLSDSKVPSTFAAKVAS